MSYSREEKIRRETIAYAYRLAVRDGIDALKDRVTRNEVTDCPACVGQKDLLDFEQKVKKTTMTMAMACVFSALEKLGHTTEQMDAVATETMEIFDTIYGGWLEWADLVEYFRDEHGIDIETKVMESDERFAAIEQKLQTRTEFTGDKKPYQRRK